MKRLPGSGRSTFEELLNPTKPQSGTETEQEDEGGSMPITLQVIEVAIQLHIGKAPGVDKIHPEMRKSLEVEVVSSVTRLFQDWQEVWSGAKGVAGWWSHFSKRGTRGYVPITEASHYSASWGNFTPNCLKGGSGQQTPD